MTPAMTPVLRLEGVNKSFGGLTAVGDLSMEAPYGSVTGLMGPNGAGKTTVINLITGLLPSDSGRILIGDREIQKLPAHEIAGAGVARTYQNVRLFAGMTALEQVMAGCYLRRNCSLLASFLALPSARAASQPGTSLAAMRVGGSNRPSHTSGPAAPLRAAARPASFGSSARPAS